MFTPPAYYTEHVNNLLIAKFSSGMDTILPGSAPWSDTSAGGVHTVQGREEMHSAVLLNTSSQDTREEWLVQPDLPRWVRTSLVGVHIMVGGGGAGGNGITKGLFVLP